jgi:CRISPR/Cas system-associated exonuclease Cas4 (RecB family)
MAIMTIADLKKASPEEVKQCLAKVSIIPSLWQYQQWMSSNGVKVQIDLEVGPGGSRSLGIHPSSVCKVGVCPLQLYYECTGEIPQIEQFDQDLQDTFDEGTARHKILQTYLHQMFGEQFQSEVRLKDDELHIISSADGLFTFSDCRFILEIKTIKEGGNYGFEKVVQQPLTDNYRQLMMYMHLADVPFGLVFYFCKNNSAKREHALRYEPATWFELENIIKPVVAAAYHGGPRVKAKPDGWKCKRCKFSHACPEVRRNDEQAPRLH